MRELSLFSGVGGGLLGTHHLLGWQTKGYVEIDGYCQRVLRARINDGLLDDAPIFGDIRAFIDDGYAEGYQGMVDVVSGGFPCQPFSFAGKRAGADDPRNQWPATIECVRIVRPQYCFLENVPGLLATGYFGRILGELAESGYDVRWRVLSAAEVGAPHKRDRLWIVAYRAKPREHREQSDCIFSERQDWEGEKREKSNDGGSGELANSNNSRCDGRPDEQGFEAAERMRAGEDGEDVADTTSTRCQYDSEMSEREEQPRRNATWSGCGDGNVQHAESEGLEEWRQKLFTGTTWWSIEPRLDRVAHGVPNRVDRLKAIGNAQVPLVAATAWRLLIGGV